MLVSSLIQKGLWHCCLELRCSKEFSSSQVEKCLHCHKTAPTSTLKELAHFLLFHSKSLSLVFVVLLSSSSALESCLHRYVPCL